MKEDSFLMKGALAEMATKEHSFTCHPKLLSIFEQWSSIKKTPALGPTPLDIIRQAKQSVLIASSKFPKMSDPVLFLSNFNWACSELSTLKIRCLHKGCLEDKSIKQEYWDEIVRSAWLEIAALLHDGIDVKVGIFQWLEVINSAFPSDLRSAVFETNQVTLEQIANWRGMTIGALKYNQKLYNESVAKSHRPLAF